MVLIIHLETRQMWKVYQESCSCSVKSTQSNIPESGNYVKRYQQNPRFLLASVFTESCKSETTLSPKSDLILNALPIV